MAKTITYKKDLMELQIDTQTTLVEAFNKSVNGHVVFQIIAEHYGYVDLDVDMSLPKGIETLGEEVILASYGTTIGDLERYFADEKKESEKDISNGQAIRKLLDVEKNEQWNSKWEIDEKILEFYTIFNESAVRNSSLPIKKQKELLSKLAKILRSR